MPDRLDRRAGIQTGISLTHPVVSDYIKPKASYSYYGWASLIIFAVGHLIANKDPLQTLHFVLREIGNVFVSEILSPDPVSAIYQNMTHNLSTLQ